MLEKTLYIDMIPRDLLFCRDGRPMEGSWSGSGGYLPGPVTFHGAAVAEYCRRYPEELKAKYSEKLTSGLRIVGPFLKKDNQNFFSTPLDVTPDNGFMELEKLEGCSDLQDFLEYALFMSKPEKKTAAPYISFENFQKYLAGEEFKTVGESFFFEHETRPGIAIDPKTRTAAESQFYDARYLRLLDGVSLSGEIIMNCGNELENLFTFPNNTLQLGGQQSLVYVKPQMGKKINFPQVKITGTLVKYVLLTPAAYLNGWYPDFVEQDGTLQLKAETGERPERLPGETRSEYRKRIEKVPIKAKMIAARVGKPLAISGWKLKNESSGTPRATRLYVPAGSVYYFRAQDETHAQLLANALTGSPRSAYGARGGCGIGVCGNFKIN